MTSGGGQCSWTRSSRSTPRFSRERSVHPRNASRWYAALTCGWARRPIFVATVIPASGPRWASSRPTRRSLRPSPYTSAVSRKVTPESTAASRIAIAPSSVMSPQSEPSCQQPSPITLTGRCTRPSTRVSMGTTLSRTGQVGSRPGGSPRTWWRRSAGRGQRRRPPAHRWRQRFAAGRRAHATISPLGHNDTSHPNVPGPFTLDDDRPEGGADAAEHPTGRSDDQRPCAADRARRDPASLPDVRADVVHRLLRDQPLDGRHPGDRHRARCRPVAVSYTHLTLPTIYSV